MKRLNFITLSLIIVILALTGVVSAAQQITISNVVMNPDGTGTATVTMNSAPTGLAGFKLNLAITNPSVSDNITFVTYPSGFTLFDTKGSSWPESVDYNDVDTLALGGFSDGYVKAMTFSRSTFPNSSTNLLLATVTLHGLSAGSTTLHGTLQTMTDNFGGNYVPTTTVTDGTITVNGPPTAAFTTNLTSGTAPLSVKFTDASTGTGPLTYSWDFTNDGATDSTLQNPTYTYPAAGVYTAKLTVTNTAGSNFVTHVITVNPAPIAPTAAFTTNVTSGTAPLAVKFTDASIGTAPLTYSWDFTNDGIPDSSLQNPTFVYPDAGSYTANLTVTNIAGKNSVTHVITVTAAPVAPTALFNTNVTSGTAPLAVKFTDASTGTAPLTYSWDFTNDGIPDSTLQNPTFVYPDAGSFTANLTVTNIAGKSSVTHVITVNPAPVAPTAAFTTNVTSGTAPLAVKFTDASTGTAPLTYSWDFTNDGILDSSLQNPTFVYPAAGSYTVNLTVTNIAGKSSVTHVITVTAAPIAPATLFSTNVTSGTAPLAVKFTDASTGTAPLTYSWDFTNDGIPDSSLQNPAFVYASAGSYTANLTVTNIAGKSSVTHVITVTIAPVAPTAAFSTNVTSGTAPLAVKFTGASTGTAPLTYSWDFTNDGTPDSTLQNPEHVYPTAGSYTANLTVTNAVGKSSVTHVIMVSAAPVAPVAGFTATPNYLTVQFTETSTGTEPMTCMWNFGDGSSSSEDSPSHTYAAAGTYSVTLMVINAAGSDDETRSITVYAAPVAPTAGFSSNVTSGTAPLAVRFTDASTGTAPLTWSWDFNGDSTPDSTLRNPLHTFSAPGTYLVTLTVSNAAGQSTITHTVTVSAPVIKTPGERIQDTIRYIRTLNLEPGKENSLTAKLNAALKSFDKENTIPAKNQLNACLNEIAAQKGKALSDKQAAVLTVDIQEIIHLF